jgi:hypothetical protein
VLGGLGQQAVGEPLERQAGVVRGVRHRVDHLLGDGHRQRRQRREPLGQLERPREALARAGDFRHEPEPVRLLRAEPAAEQHELLRPRRADEPHQPMRSARAGEDADADLRQGERRARLGDPEVRRQRELEAAAEAVAGDRADRRLGETSDPLVDGAGRAIVGEDRRRVHVAQLADVGAGRERARTPAEDHARARAHVVLVERVADRRLELRRERVELLLAAQRDHGRRAVAAHVDERASHADAASRRGATSARVIAPPR